MADRYDPKVEEEKWVLNWEKNGIFKFNPEAKGETYSIDTPPPTVSGKMHIGHAFSYTQQDIIARYKRLRGFNVFYPFGTDDNGLATIRLIEKTKNVKEQRMSRDEFIALCLQTLKELRPPLIQDWKNIGISSDFTINYSTIDDNSRRISQKTFLELAKKSLVYRKEAPVIWDTTFQTAIAQAELVDIERASNFNDVIFKGEDGKDIVIGVYNKSMIVPGIPAKLPFLAFRLVLEVDRKFKECEVEFLTPQRKKLIESKIRLNIGNLDEWVRLTLKVADPVFETDGRYIFWVKLDGRRREAGSIYVRTPTKEEKASDII